MIGIILSQWIGVALKARAREMLEAAYNSNVRVAASRTHASLSHSFSYKTFSLLLTHWSFYRIIPHFKIVNLWFSHPGICSGWSRDSNDFSFFLHDHPNRREWQGSRRLSYLANVAPSRRAKGNSWCLWSGLRIGFHCLLPSGVTKEWWLTHDPPAGASEPSTWFDYHIAFILPTYVKRTAFGKKICIKQKLYTQYTSSLHSIPFP